MYAADVWTSYPRTANNLACHLRIMFSTPSAAISASGVRRDNESMKRAGLRQDLTSRNTRKGKLFGEMNREVPWVGLLAPIAPHTPRRGRGCPPVVAEVMRRVHFLQQLFGVTAMAMEDARFDVPLYR